MLNTVTTYESLDHGLAEARDLLDYCRDSIGTGEFNTLKTIQRDVQLYIGAVEHPHSLTKPPLSTVAMISDYLATNEAMLASEFDLSWLPDSYEEFCTYLIPSKPIFDLVDYKPFDYQIKLAEILDDPDVRTVNVYKSRQTGLSEFVVSYILYKFLQACRVGDQYTVLVYSMTQKDASALGSRMVIMYDQIRQGITDAEGRMCRGPDFTRDSATEKVMANVCDIKFMATTGGRGTPAVDLVVIDESDFIPEIDEVVKRCTPALGNSGGKFISITTPNGEKGFAYKKLTEIDPIALSESITEAKRPGSAGWGTFSDDDGFNVGVVVHYSAHPKYDEEWRIRTKAALKLDDASWNQEFELSTVASGSAFFNYKHIKACSGIVTGVAADYSSIVIGVDPSSAGRDKTAIVVWGVKSGDDKFYLIEEVYNADLEGTDQVETIVALYHKYDPYCIVVETNGLGQFIWEYVSKELDGYPVDIDRVNTTATNKIGALKLLRSEIASHRVKYNHDSAIRDELPNFLEKQKGNSKFTYEARYGYYDDAICASSSAVSKLKLEPDYKFLVDV